MGCKHGHCRPHPIPGATASASASSGADPDANPGPGSDAGATADDPRAEADAPAASGADRASDGDADPDRYLGLSRREWGYVLLLSVPPGVGAAVGIDTTLRTGLLAPVALAAGAAAAVTVFALVVVGLRTGTVDESLSPRDP